MLREDKRADVERGVLRVRFVTGELVGGWMGRRAYARIREEQEYEPVPILQHERRQWWMFRGRVFWEEDGLEADDVLALLLDRERRKERRLQRARDMMLVADGAGRRREPIPEDLRREVFRRDGGRCVGCGRNELLQFDHVIPVAMGGAHTIENLQLLCAPCNRDKGASL
jgi:5-methylcytosine-specific restriction endonuclease McrA